MSSNVRERHTPSGDSLNTADTQADEHGHQGAKPRRGGRHPDVPIITFKSFILAIVISMGGFIFGYDTGQISGILVMDDFVKRFGQNGPQGYSFSNVRSGLIVGLLSIGTLIGALVGAPIADKIGRKMSIIFWCVIFSVGVIIQVASSTSWVQIAMGRWVAGLGVGALSLLVPMYQSETSARHIRGALISCYQLFVTLGIFVADCIAFGTEKRADSGSWRIPMAIGWLWALILGVGMLFQRESPRYAYRHDRKDEARKTFAQSYGVPEDHIVIRHELRDVEEKLEEERQHKATAKWTDAFTAPAMPRRLLLGVGLQMFQQLTGANYFFYYGTTIFKATGIENSYVTAMILGGVNFGSTFLGLWFIERFGRRKCLIWGAIWMGCCFLVFASVGAFSLDNQTPQNTPKSGAAMIVFACLFILAFASTWGPMIWSVVGELYPGKYRAFGMSLATASNWGWNFLLAFFTPFITGDIGFKFGYVFAGCNFAAAVTVYLFVIEPKGRSLEQIDTMYVLHVPSRQSEKWEADEMDERRMQEKTDSADKHEAPAGQHVENVARE